MCGGGGSGLLTAAGQGRRLPGDVWPGTASGEASQRGGKPLPSHPSSPCISCRGSAPIKPEESMENKGAVHEAHADMEKTPSSAEPWGG